MASQRTKMGYPPGARRGPASRVARLGLTCVVLLMLGSAAPHGTLAQTQANQHAPGSAGAPYANMPEIAPIGVRIGKYLDVPESAKGPAVDPAKGYRIQELGTGLYMITDLAGHHQPLKVWVLCLYFMGLNVSNEQIAQELAVNGSDVQQMTTQLRAGEDTTMRQRKVIKTTLGELLGVDTEATWRSDRGGWQVSSTVMFIRVAT